MKVSKIDSADHLLSGLSDLISAVSFHAREGGIQKVLVFLDSGSRQLSPACPE
ncbi:MAG TPA: hypothetical protein VIH18_07675 [Candidatus Binatia bacterium]